MKILLISNKCPWPPKDGGSSATLNMITGLASAGASVTILSLNTSRHRVSIDDLPAEIAGNTHLVNVDSSIKLFKLLTNLLFSDKPYTLTRFESYDFGKKLSSLLKNSYDLIQVEGLAMTCYLPLIRSLTKSKIVYRPHNVENLIWSRLADEEKNILKRYYFRIIASRTKKTEKTIINSFDAVAAMSPADIQWFIRSGLSIPSVVSPPGIPSNLLSSNDVSDKSVFFIGALDWRPNISGLRWFILNVWPLVVHSEPGATFHIAGRNPSKKVRKMCRGEGIIFYGEIESSQMFISDKAVMVVPLFSGSGIRTKILEGMQMGRCIVATSAAAEGMEHENGKNIFLADDAGNFARHILVLIRDENLRISAGLNAVENVRKNYNILVTADNLLKFYSQLF